MKTKKLIARNLPINTTYKIIGSYYKSLDDGAGCCDNCGKIITNIAEIESAQGHKYNVGIDCAETLAGIKESFDFEFIHKANFQTAKSTRATLLKAIKSGKIKNLTVKTFEDTNNFHKQINSGKWEYEFVSGGYNWKQYPADQWLNYILPMIKDIKC